MRRGVPLILSIAALIAAIGIFAAVRYADSDTFVAGSVFNDGPEGTSVAERYLRQRTAVQVLLEPLDRALVPSNAVVLRIAPTHDQRLPSEEKRSRASILTSAEEEWLLAGGRLVLLLDASYGTIEVADNSHPPAKVFPVWPAVSRLEPLPMRGLRGTGLRDAHSLFTTGSDTAMARIAVGRGEILVSASPEVLYNGNIARADHLPLLDAMTAGRPVWFDEYAHGLGARTGLISLMLRWNLGPLLFLLLLTFALFMWRGNVRLGSADRDGGDRRSEAVDMVDSLAELYRRALSDDEALELYHRNLRETASLRTGLRADALDARMNELTSEYRARPRGKNFKHDLEVLNGAFRRLDGRQH